MNLVPVIAAPCSGFGYLVILGMIFWIGSILQKVPQDVSVLHRSYIEQDWLEFKINILHVGFYWGSILFCFFYFYAAYSMPEREYG